MANNNKHFFKTKDTAGKELKLEVIKPTQRILQEGDIRYRIAYGDALRRGCTTRVEIKNIMEERQLFSTKWEKEYTDSLTNLEKLQDRFADLKEDNVEKKAVALELKLTRQHMVELNTQVEGMYKNTAENVGEEYKMQYLCVECTYHPGTMEKYFADEEDFLNRDDEQAAADSLMATYKFMYDMPADIYGQYAENKYLKEQGILDEEYNFKDVTENISDKEDEEVKEKEPKQKSKKKSKKKEVVNT